MATLGGMNHWRGSVLVAILMFSVFGCVNTSNSSRSEQRAFEAWCEYVIEADSTSGTVSQCADELRTRGAWVPESPAQLREYIVLDQLIFRVCERDADQYESIEQCRSSVKTTLAQSLDDGNPSLDLLISVGMATGALSEMPGGCGSTWRINGQIYNDPWGVDFKNDSSDCYGDGR